MLIKELMHYALRANHSFFLLLLREIFIRQEKKKYWDKI